MIYVVKNILNNKYVKFNQNSYEEVENKNNATLIEGPIFGVGKLQRLIVHFKLNRNTYKPVGFKGDFE